MKKPFRVLKAAPVVSLNFRSSYLKTSMVPSSDAQAMELDPWQKTNAFIFQPAKKKHAGLIWTAPRLKTSMRFIIISLALRADKMNESSVLIGYQNRQDGAGAARDYPLCPAMSWPGLCRQEGWMLGSFFFSRVYGPRRNEVHKHPKTNLVNIQP